MAEETNEEQGIEVIEDASTQQYNVPIFPMTIVKRIENTLSMETVLRKKHRGKWYLWEFMRNAYVPEGRMDFSAAVSSFNRDVYMCMLHGKVNTKFTYKDGSPVFKLDKNQMDEVLRMKPLDYVKPQTKKS